MKTELFTVSRIFNEALYRIPDYQRGFSWELQQLKDFWLDLEQLEPNKSHYTGVLTLEAVPEEVLTTKEWADDAWIVKSKRFSPYYVVDGQQRLTTIVILIQAILECNLPPKLNHTLIADIRRKYIFDSKDEQSRSYIFGYVVDNPSYEYLKTKIYQEHSTRHAPDEETIYTKNLRTAKEFFTEKLSDLSQKDIEVIFTKITQQLVFNAYEIAKEIDVFVTFETMNNRGKALSNLELVKNRLIYLAMKMGPNDSDAALLRGRINEAWKTIYHYLGKNENRPLNDDQFLKSHMQHYYYGELVKLPDDEEERAKAIRRGYHRIDEIGRFLLNELFTQKRLKGSSPSEFTDLTPEFVNTYAQRLKAAVVMYYKLSTPNDSDFSDIEKGYLERIVRLRGYSASPMILSLFLNVKDAKKRALFLNNWEHLIFLRTLRSHDAYGRVIQTPLDHTAYMSGKISIDEAITSLSNGIVEYLKDVPITETLQDWMKVGMGYYGWKSIKYFLFEYELFLAERSKTSRTKIDWATFSAEDMADYDTVEHIYPQRARHAYWTERFGKYTPAQRKAMRNSLGNLLALSRPKNSSLSNLPFPDKKGKPGTSIGFIYGGYSENEVASSEDWGPHQILTRGLQMLDFLEIRWGIKIGDHAQKARALGLEFLISGGGSYKP